MQIELDQAKQFIEDEESAAAIEYALLAGLIALGIIVGAALLGTTISNLFSKSLPLG